MYAVKIHGWTEIVVFSADIEKAKRKAVREKKRLCHDDLNKWTWETVTEYYGTSVIEIKEGLMLVEGEER